MRVRLYMIPDGLKDDALDRDYWLNMLREKIKNVDASTIKDGYVEADIDEKDHPGLANNPAVTIVRLNPFKK